MRGLSVPKEFRNSAEAVPVGGLGCASAAVTRIGAARVDLDTGRVVAAGGAVTELRPKTAALLRALAANRGRVCSKDELIGEVWPGLSIEEDGLVQCIGEIRRALGSDKGEIRTHAKRGYALEPAPEPPVVPEPPTAPAPERPKRRRIPALVAVALVVVAGVAAAAVASRDPPPAAATDFLGPLVAVLPFAALTRTDDWDLLARALTEDVISDLAQNTWLYVFADAATRQLAEPKFVAAQAIGAAYVVTGTLQVEGATAQIRAGLVEAATGRQLWTKTFEGEVGDLLALQRQASEAITGELSSAWTGPVARAEKARARGRGTADLTAYELYMRAGELMGTYTPENLAEAERLLKRVVALEPRFGEAWAKLSLLSFNRLRPELSETETRALIEQGDATALEGLRVAPDRPNVLGQAANVVRWTDPAKAEAMIVRAAELAPNDADILAYLAFRAAHFPALAKAAERWINRAIRLNPARPDWYDWNRAAVMMVLGRYRDAADAYARAPDHVEARAGRIAALALAGQVETAHAELVALQGTAPHFSAAWFAEAAGLHPDVAAVYAHGFAIAGGDAHDLEGRR